MVDLELLACSSIAAGEENLGLDLVLHLSGGGEGAVCFDEGREGAAERQVEQNGRLKVRQANSHIKRLNWRTWTGPQNICFFKKKQCKK